MSDEDFEALLQHVRSVRGFDFTNYKRSTLRRRVERRMQAVDAATVADYLDHLQVHPDELSALFDTVLINVTSFFRDPEAWDHLATVVLPAILAELPEETPLRAWSAGCASGEEAYTLAMVLAEALGPERFAERVKIYGTDVDDAALDTARAGVFTERQLEPVPAEMRERYFEPLGPLWAFRKDLRRSVVFGRHDLTRDAPISRLHILVCRNVLMYFTAEAQERILARFGFGLLPSGYLFLGKAETLLSRASAFQPVDLKHRLFRRAPGGPRPHLGGTTDGDRLDDGVADTTNVAAFRASPLAQVVVDAAGVVVGVNNRAAQLFRLGPPDVGKRLQDLELSYRPLELRSLIDRAIAGGRPVETANVPWRAPGGTAPMTLRIIVTPLAGDRDVSLRGAGIAFFDETRHQELEAELAASNRQLETAYEELQSTNEELETTNEELQSTVEELETTNEELQSTNEELETMNEELHSTNEEMHAVNEDFSDRSAALNQANAYLGAILTSLRAGVVVLDPDLGVRVWNDRSEELWGLRAEEVTGRSLLDLDIGLPVERLREPIREVLDGGRRAINVHIDAVNRRGRPVALDISVSALQVGTDEPGAMLLMELPPDDGDAGSGS